MKMLAITKPRRMQSSITRCLSQARINWERKRNKKNGTGVKWWDDWGRLDRQCGRSVIRFKQTTSTYNSCCSRLKTFYSHEFLVIVFFLAYLIVRGPWASDGGAIANKAIVDYTSPALCTPVTPFPPIGDAAYRQHAGGGPSRGHKQHAQN